MAIFLNNKNSSIHMHIKGYKTSTKKLSNVTLVQIENIGTLRVYKTKKGTRYDYSQIPEHFRQQIMDKVEPLTKEKVIGVDEAGKGDYFGPLVVASAYVDDPSAIRALGVQDSKRLNDEKIIELAKMIKHRCPVSVIRIGPEKYNELYARIENLNKLLAWAHATAIENLLEDYKPDYVISDKFAVESVLKSQLKNLGQNVELRQQVRAESNVAVAAASIVARAEFVLAVQKMSFDLGMDIPLGAGENVKIAAKNIALREGKEILEKYVKLHFKTTQEL